MMKFIMAPYVAVSPYTHSYSLTIDHTQCGSSDSTNFAVLVSLTLVNLATVANSGAVNNTTTFNGQTVPADLVFSSSSTYGSFLTWDVESYNPSTGNLIVWVNIPTVSHTLDTTFYMGVGKSSTTTYQGGSVGAAWNTNYKNVWHLSNGTSLNAISSVSGGFTGTINSATATTGIIDGAASFSSANISFGNSIMDTSSVGNGSLSFWLYPTATGQGSSSFNCTAILSNDNLYWGVFTPSTNKVRIWYFSTGAAQVFFDTTGTLSVNAWNKVDITWNSSGTIVYLNGVSDTTNSLTFFNINSGHNGQTTLLGNYISGFAYAGKIDEFQVMTTNKTADQITVEYNNQKSSSTLLTTTLIY